MRNYFFLFFIQCLFSLTSLQAHQPDETYTTIEKKDEYISARLELPWTIGKALNQVYPEIDGVKLSNEAYLVYVKKYVNDHLTLKINERLLEPFDISTIPQDHAHSIVLELKYATVSLADLEIKNTIMFNAYDKQQNFHKVYLESGQKVIFWTHADIPSFTTNKPVQQATWYNLWWVILLIMTVVVIVGLWGLKKMTVSYLYSG